MSSEPSAHHLCKLEQVLFQHFPLRDIVWQGDAVPDGFGQGFLLQRDDGGVVNASSHGVEILPDDAESPFQQCHTGSPQFTTGGDSHVRQRVLEARTNAAEFLHREMFKQGGNLLGGDFWSGVAVQECGKGK